MHDDVEGDGGQTRRRTAVPPPRLDADDSIPAASDRSGWTLVLVIIGAGLVVLFIVLHLTGVIGPGTHS